MQELRLVAVSEDGTYAILAVPGRSGRFLLPIDERLRTVAKGQFSRLAQYEIEVENPLRPKEIQDRIRAGETAEEIADAAGIPPDRIRRFEGPVLAERQYRAQEAQRATIRGRGDSGPGPRLGDIVNERLSGVGAHPDAAEWDSRKRPDGNWQVQLQFSIGGRPSTAEWIYDPRRRHVIPDDDQAVRLCLPPEEWAAVSFAERSRTTATVTPIGSRQHSMFGDQTREHERRSAGMPPRSREADFGVPGDLESGRSASPGAAVAASGAHGDGVDVTSDTPAARTASATEAGDTRAPTKKAASGRSRRASVPSWDEIMFGTSRQPD
jgi:Protein of unknown function (DUF3071)